MNSNPVTVNRFLLVGLCVAVLVIARLLPRDAGSATAYSAPPTNHRDEHAGGEDHSKAEASLKKTFDGTVDLFHTAEELAAGKAGHTGVMFAGIADITGKEMLVFSKGKERWVIDPDLVFTYRVTKSK